MAFPTTSTLDAFNRADGALGSAWSGPIDPTDSTPTLFSNAVVGVSSVFSSAYWNGATFGDCECYLTLNSDEYGYVFTRINTPNTAGLDCFFFRVEKSSGNCDWFLIIDDATVTSHTFAATIPTTTQIGMDTRNVGADIVCRTYIDGVLQTTETVVGGVATYAANVANPGYIGFALYGAGNDTSRSIDNFGGGSLTTGTVTPRTGGSPLRY